MSEPNQVPRGQDLTEELDDDALAQVTGGLNTADGGFLPPP